MFLVSRAEGGRDAAERKSGQGEERGIREGELGFCCCCAKGGGENNFSGILTLSRPTEGEQEGEKAITESSFPHE